LLVHEAVVHLISKSNKRNIPVSQWFVDNRKTIIEEDEIVIGVSLNIPEKKYAGSYNKQMRYSGEDLAQSNVCILAIEDKTYRVAFGSVGPVPKRSLKLENLLNGKDIDNKLIDEAKQMIDSVIAPISDVRSSKEYRMHITKVMFERGLKTAIDRLKQPKIIS
jgi:xanthine dehydrogenase FAD-binding subunit